jgi:sulfur-oxidizing protein SoxY
VTSMKRRIFLKGTLATGALGIAAGSGLLAPRSVLAAWSKEAFEARDLNSALNSLLGSSTLSASDKVRIKAPDIAENGAVVPVSVSADLPGVESINIVVEKNPNPLAANFVLGPGALPEVSTRIKMGKSSSVLAVVKAGGKLYSTGKEVKVTIGGCGG